MHLSQGWKKFRFWNPLKKTIPTNLISCEFNIKPNMFHKNEFIWFLKYGLFLFSICYFCICIVTVFYLVFTSSHGPQPCFALYVYIQITANWIMVYKTCNMDFGDELPSDSAYCTKCNIFKQKQSHHCPLCDCCILRQDHHCFFLGTCIGLNNQLYFLVLVFWGAIGYLYLCVEIFINSEITYDHWYNYFELFFPVGFVAAFIRGNSISSVYLLLIFNVSLTIGVFSFLMFILQIYLISLNITWYEFTNKSDWSHRQFAWKNIVSGFGRYGLLAFIVPLPKNYLAPSSCPRTLVNNR